MLTTILVCILAGLGAGLGTGFAGMSAAAVISPMLITFLGMEPYQAIGIALASDVLASAVSAYEYGKNKNLDIKNGLVMMFTVMIFTFIASFLFQIYFWKYHGQLFHCYDHASWNQIYCKTCHDHQGNYDGR